MKNGLPADTGGPFFTGILKWVLTSVNRNPIIQVCIRMNRNQYY